MVALTFALLACSLPVAAQAAGCAQLDDAALQADCAAREHAREEARRAVAERLESDSPAASPRSASRSSAWQEAVDEASGPDLGAIFSPRPIAAIVGIVWFVLLVRRTWRRRARASSR